MTRPRHSPGAGAAGAATTAATLGAFAMIAYQVAGKAARDALFLSTYGIETLPRMIIASALFSIVAVLATSRLLGRHGPGKLVPGAFAVSGLCLLAIWPLFVAARSAAAIALYLHLSVGGSMLISWFWSLVNERFDPRTARRSIGRIAGGGTAGGVVGGLLAERVAALATVPPEMLLPLLALFHFFCAGMTLRVRPAPGATARIAPATASETTSTWSGLPLLRRMPYLRNLALLVLVTTVGAACLDFVFKSHAAARYAGDEDLLRFFAVFYTATGVATFLVQSAFTRRLLEGIGLANSAALLPLAVGSGGLCLFVPGLWRVWFVAIVSGAESVLRSSVFRSSYELFFTPVSPRDKRATKTLVDVGFDRLGDAVGGGLIQLVLFVAAATTVTPAAGLPRPALLVLVGIAVALAAGAYLVTRRLHAGYVAALETSLLARSVVLDADDVADGTTRTVFLRAIPDLATAGAPPTPRPAVARTRPAVGPLAVEKPTAAAARDPLLARIAELRSGDPDRVRAQLGDEAPLPPGLLPHAVRLLGWDEVSTEAIRALRRDCDRHAGQLLDALLDPDEEFVIRRRLPRALAAGSSPRLVSGLLSGLADPRFEVRYQCGLALVRIRARDPNVVISRSAVLVTVSREVAVEKGVWRSRQLLDDADEREDAPFLDEVLRARSDRSLEHVFTMLSLVYPQEPLRIAFRGLFTDDENLRGTALEYLESILPDGLRESLWPFLEDHRPEAAARAQSKTEILDSLLRSHESIRLNLEKLRDARDE